MIACFKMAFSTVSQCICNLNADSIGCDIKFQGLN